MSNRNKSSLDEEIYIYIGNGNEIYIQILMEHCVVLAFNLQVFYWLKKKKQVTKLCDF